MISQCKNLMTMLQNCTIPIRGGQWIDAYNKSTSPIAGTIKARIDHNNLYFVTELYEITQDTTHPRLLQE